MIYQHIKSDINDTKMHASKQTDQYDVTPPCSDGSGQGGGDDDEHSRRQSSVQIRVFPESPTCILKQNWQDRHVLSLCLHVLSSLCLSLGSGVHMAVCCILSALAFLWRWDQLITQGSQQGGRAQQGAGFQVCIAFTLQHNMKSAAQPHLVQHEIQEGTLTPGLECDVVVWNVWSMECWGGDQQGNGGMWCHMGCTCRHMGGYSNVFWLFFAGMCAHALLWLLKLDSFNKICLEAINILANALIRFLAECKNNKIPTKTQLVVILWCCGVSVGFTKLNIT